MRLIGFLSGCVFASLVLLHAQLFAQTPSHANLSNLVVVGDSLSAGVQNFSLLDTQQPHGYASVIAQQANVPLLLPLVPYPGAPNVLQLTSLNPPTIQPVTGSLPPLPRDNPCLQPTNVAVPGVTVGQALSDPPTATPSTPIDYWVDIVLGFPNPLAATPCQTSGAALTQIQQAVALKPTTVIEWLGNNDALVPALTGTLNTLTPLSTFAENYAAVLDALKGTHARMITANIPDVTKVPYFTSIATLASQVKMPLGTVKNKLGVGPNDLLRPSATPIALSILANQQSGPLPQTCPVPLAALPVSSVPCVLTAAQAEQVQLTIDAYNLVIFAESLLHGAQFVDIHGLVDQIARDGYTADGKHLTAAFLGGLFSLDGIHPTNTGYAIIANSFIQVMNRSWNTNIPPADVDAIAAADPLVPPVPPGTLVIKKR
jgi:lysophospholipase L1-like esterase